MVVLEKSEREFESLHPIFSRSLTSPLPFYSIKTQRVHGSRHAIDRQKHALIFQSPYAQPVLAPEPPSIAPYFVHIFMSSRFPLPLLGKVPANELQIYTWKDATLKELTSLIREVLLKREISPSLTFMAFLPRCSPGQH